MSLDRGARGDGRQRRQWQALQFAGPLTFDPNNQQVTISLGKGLELDGNLAIQADLDASSLVFNGNDIRVLAGEGIQLDSGVALDIDGLTEQTAPGIDDALAIFDDALGAHRKVLLETLRDLFLPAGVVAAWAVSTAPAGWLICDGSAVSRTTYSRLFAAIGTTFGAGDGSTTFNLPNCRQRVIAGLLVAGFGTMRAMGETGGSINHIHSLNGNLSPGVGDCIGVDENPVSIFTVPSCGETIPITGTTNSANQAYITMHFIIKT